MQRRASNPRSSARFTRRAQVPQVEEDSTVETSAANNPTYQRRQLSAIPANDAVQAPAGPALDDRFLRSFFAAGFECSTHIRRSGYRLDLVADTAHDKWAMQDYSRLQREGIRVAREGVRWHLVEKEPGRYDFSSVLSIVQAARATQTQVIWDLCHFGWPDHLDVFSQDFVPRLAGYGSAFVQWLKRELDDVPFIVPVNEISYFSWAAGDEASMYPFVLDRGFELKQQLVRATIASIRAIRSVAPQARFVQVDPIINVIASPKHPEEAADAEAYRESQYQAFDMLCGRLSPELGGGNEFLDIIGVNYYPHNQWIYNLKNRRRVRKFQPINRRNPLHRPFREMLLEINQRYQRPLFIAETGAEDRRRAGWFDYVCQEAWHAMTAGVPLQGICLYPILNHPGWLDDRHCHNALWDYPDGHGNREIYQPLARELRRWRKVFEEAHPAPPAKQKGSFHTTKAL